MKYGLIALTAALVMLAVPAFAGPPVVCSGADTDGDGVLASCDNCDAISNAGAQGCDTDNDGYGNMCDGDFDNSGFVLSGDFTGIFVPDFITGLDSGGGTDMDCSGFVLSGDFTGLFVPQFVQGIPGSSGLACAGSVGCGATAQN
jgi:hypothetical protein